MFKIHKKKQKGTKRKEKFQFSLIELLIVITIIVILAGILFPAFSKVRAKTIAIQCNSNMKQIGLILFIYSGDGNDYIIASSFGSTYWGRNLYIGGYFNNLSFFDNNINWPKIMSCPGQRENLGTTPRPYAQINDSIGYHYGLNYYTSPPMSGGVDPVFNKINKYTKLSQINMASESSGYYYVRETITSTSGYNLNLRHNRSANVLYLDGHLGTIFKYQPDRDDVFWSHK